MDITKINELITSYEKQLGKLQPTLHPGKELPYNKIGILNIARHKSKKYEANITFLQILKTHPELPDDVIEQVLK